MDMAKRIKTSYPGVYYRIVRRLGKKGTEKVFYITFKQNGKMIEEKVGRQYRDNMSAAKAATRRGERVENRRLSPKQIQTLSEVRQWTFDALWAEYERQKGNVNQADRSRFKNYIEQTIGDKRPADLLPLDIDRIRLKNLKGKSDQTVYSVLALITRLSAFGIKKMLCPGLPFKIEKPKVFNDRTESLSLEELKGLLQVLEENPSDISSAMQLALFTGMRKMEVLKLQWRDVDFEQGFITIRDPKGGPNQKIPLNDQARGVLERQVKTSDFVFPGPHGLRSQNIYATANDLKKKAGLPDEFRAFHGLRHAFASLLASSGKVDLYVLQKLLTHKNPKETQRYAHLRDETLKDASNVMGDILAEIGGGK
ncbi:MAG: site-specific integrase [Proteobacteria bacterium]|nr:site-specific integrase [Pseudomonadota bacterium]